MTDTNVLNYFLVVLGGFGVVWSFRHFSHHQGKKISEFEYAAFSAIWGIPVFFIFLDAEKSRPDFLNAIFATPMLATPALFLLGAALGGLGAKITMVGSIFWKYIEFKLHSKK